MTFISPFDSLGENWNVEHTDWELWTGAFACGEKDCYGVANEAKYSREHKILTWKCPHGHVGKIEDYIG